MKIAIIGGGISGLTCAWQLHAAHEVTVFEAGEQPGGHSNTVEFEREGRVFQIDTGFIVYNDRTYPNFMKLLSHLGVEGVATAMSFAVRCDRTGIEYCGSGLNGVFAQRRNLFRLSFLQMVADILKFNREGTRDADTVDHDETVQHYLIRGGYSQAFADHYLLPMGAAIWSCPRGTFGEFPIRFILEFYRNHGLLALRNRPQWYTIPGGSRRYVNQLVRPFRDRLRLKTPVRSVRRSADCVTVMTDRGEEHFDEVIFACHSDQALRILDAPSALESSVLRGFPYELNEAVLHTDTSILPATRRAWSAWNYRIGVEPESRATITYNMNILQHIQSNETFCVTLNDTKGIDSSKVISRHRYAHPIFTTDRMELQKKHPQLIRENRTSFCGAYWGNGFHEDGVNSALAVSGAFGIHGVQPGTTSARTSVPTSETHTAMVTGAA
ncbi:MAG: FAD-dependent oxidoreductase [Planctomycetaceae bacterium]